ncbi:hypothetical protein ACNFJ7_02110 [Sphingomonas sp. HT-1]|uniref:hypothetical protein n=1 Tax=unclassified Sphingomonas TaxID=196159 RepID=UPI00128F9804|nr:MULTISPECIES: hypothetical protein [unclassified Sphingomonas]
MTTMPDRGTALPPIPPADGGRMPPAANTFGDFVRFLEDGQFDVELTEVMKSLAGEMANAAIDSGGKSKGKLTLTFDFALEGRVFSIAAKHKVDLPVAKRPKSVMWTTEDMRFTPSNPAQGHLFGVREVGGAGGFRDA